MEGKTLDLGWEQGSLCAFVSHLDVSGTQKAAHNLINNCRALTSCQGFGLDINGHTLPLQIRQAFHVRMPTDSDRNTQTFATTRSHSMTYTQTGTAAYTQVYLPYAQINASVCVCGCFSRIFHFITSFVCDDTDKTVVTEISEGGRKRGFEIEREIMYFN